MATDAAKISISLKNLQDYDTKIKEYLDDKGFTVDDTLSGSSENPVQNKVITETVNKKVDKVEGKGLSANDYNDTDKAEVAKIKNKLDATTEATNAGKYVRVNGNGELVFDEVIADANANSYTISTEPNKSFSCTLPVSGTVTIEAHIIAGYRNITTITRNDEELYKGGQNTTLSYEFSKGDVLTVTCLEHGYALITIPGTSESLLQQVIAPAWDSEKTYLLNDIVMYENVIYKCINNDVTSTTSPLEDHTNWTVTTAAQASSINIVKEWSETLSDNNIPSEKLVKDNLEDYGITNMSFNTGRYNSNFTYTLTATGIVNYKNIKYASNYCSATIYKNNEKIDGWWNDSGSGSALFKEGDVLGVYTAANANVFVTVPIKVKEILDNTIANQWVPESNYNTNDYVIYNSGLYKCISNIESSTTNPLEDGDNWSKVLLGDVLSNQGEEPLAKNLSGANYYESSVTYDVVGNAENKPSYCIYNNCLYKCINTCVGTLPTDTTYWEKFDLTSTPTFDNQTTLDKLSVSDDGKLLFDNKEVENTINNITNNNVTNTTVDGDMYLDIDKYSEEEVVVGTWIDGRPIYRKVISNLTIPITTSESSKIKISDDSINIIKFSAQDGWGQFYNTSIVEKYDNDTTITFRCTTSYSASKIAIIIIEYTKTTDTDNSFTADMVTSNIQVAGVGYDNYSEDEIVIGKWIDGKPIYRKVFEFNEGSYGYYGDVQYLEIEITNNINEIINSSGNFMLGSSRIIPINSSEMAWDIKPLYSSYIFVMDNTVFFYFALNKKNQTGTITEFSENLKGKIILDYTKTTDQLNSFTPGMVAGNLISLPDGGSGSSCETYTDEEINTLINNIYGGTE